MEAVQSAGGLADFFQAHEEGMENKKEFDRMRKKAQEIVRDLGDCPPNTYEVQFVIEEGGALRLL